MTSLPPPWRVTGRSYVVLCFDHATSRPSARPSGGVVFEINRCKWRQEQLRISRPMLPHHLVRNDLALVSRVRSRIPAGVGIDPFDPAPRLGHGDTIAAARHRGHVGDDHYR